MALKYKIKSIPHNIGNKKNVGSFISAHIEHQGYSKYFYQSAWMKRIYCWTPHKPFSHTVLVSRSVHHFDPDWIISIATWFIAVKHSQLPEDELYWLMTYSLTDCFFGEISQQFQTNFNKNLANWCRPLYFLYCHHQANNPVCPIICFMIKYLQK